MSVPARRGPWWYYSRTEEGKSYAIHCRRPARGRDELPPAGEPGDEEQILLDENVEAEGSEYFAVGGAAVSHDHRWLAYSTDRSRRREVRAALPAPRRRDVPRRRARDGARDRLRARLVGRRGRRLLRAHGRGPAAPPAVAPPPGHRSRRRRAGLRGGRPALLARDGLDPRHRLRAASGCTARTRASGGPSPRASRWPPRRWSWPAARASSTRVDHLTPAAGDMGWFVALTNEDALDFRVLAAPDTELGSGAAGAWREVVPHRPGVRVEDVDAFAGALVLSERAEAETRVRVLPLGGDPPSGRDDRPFRRRSARRRLGRPLARQPLDHLARRQPRARRAGAAHRAHDDGHPLERPAGRPRGPRRDAPQAGARPGRLRPGPLRDLPGVGGRAGRDPGPDLGRPAQGPRRCRRRASSTATAPTRCRSTRPSRTTASRSSTAASSSPSPTCGAAARWAGPGTRTAAWSTRPTPSPTSSPAAATSSSAASRAPTRSPAAAPRPAAS